MVIFYDPTPNVVVFAITFASVHPLNTLTVEIFLYSFIIKDSMVVSPTPIHGALSYFSLSFFLKSAGYMNQTQDLLV